TATVSELECIGQQVLEYLLQTFAVCDKAARERGISLDVEPQLLVLRFVPEWARHHVHQAGEEYLLCLHGNGSGFNLRKIEDVADQVQQVGSCPVNRSGELNLLAGQVALRVVRELLPKHEDAVQWSA